MSILSQQTKILLVVVTCIAFGLVFANIGALIVILVSHTSPFLSLLVRTVFALLFSMYVLALTKQLRDGNRKRARRSIVLVCVYAVVASILYLMFVSGLPDWVIYLQWTTLGCYVIQLGIVSSRTVRIWCAE